MLTLPSAPPAAPRRQLLVGVCLVSAAMIAMYAGMLGIYARFRDASIAIDGVWKPSSVKVPEVATNVMLISFLATFVFVQWAVYAARRHHTAYVALALFLTALVGAAQLNAQAFVYQQMELPAAEGSYQVLFYAVTGTYVVLTIAGVFFSLVAAFRYLGGRTREREIIAAHAIYWYALSAVFAALWFVVYVTK